jgi:hypothetical protein
MTRNLAAKLAESLELISEFLSDIIDPLSSYAYVSLWCVEDVLKQLH